MPPTLHKTTARYALAVLAGVEGLAALQRHRRRSVLYERAKARAIATDRQLVVVGDPDAGAHTSLKRAYGCGDLCLDLNGAPGCRVAAAVDITKGNSPVLSDSAVVYVACVLEYVDKPKAAWAEVLRMAGSPDNVYMAVVQPWTLTAALYPGARQTVTETGRSAPVSMCRKVLTVAGLGWLIHNAW